MRSNVKLFFFAGAVLAITSAFTPASQKSSSKSKFMFDYYWYANIEQTTGILTAEELVRENIEITGLPTDPWPAPTEYEQILDYVAEHCYTAPPICMALVKFSDGYPDQLLMTEFGSFF